MHGTVSVVRSVPEAFGQTFFERFNHRSERRFSVALSGGSTAKLCYETLAAVRGIDWSLIEVYWGDERCVALHDPDSNALMARTCLLDVVGPVGSATPMRCDLGADSYAQLLPARFDLVHLGLGPDGHTASLFPGAKALDLPERDRVTLTSDPTGVNKHPRLTITFGEIQRARSVVVTVEGEAKKWAFAQVVAGADVPASRIRNPDLLWLVDQESQE